MVHLPQGITGWTVFAVGLLIVAYRVHGVDAPRVWVEWVESQFTYAWNLRFFGAGLLVAGSALAYLAGFSEGLIGWLFVFSVALLALVGFGMVAVQNHLRLLVVATAEASDKKIRIVSILTTIIGLGLMLLPFFY